MKTTILFLISFFILNSSYSQENIALKPDVDKKCKAFVDKFNEFLILRDEKVIKKDLSTIEYGKYVGGQLISLGLADDFCMDDLFMVYYYNHVCIGANNLEVAAYLAGPKFPKNEKFMPILEGEIQYIEPQIDLYKIKCCKPVGKIKIGDKITDISCKDYLDYSNTVMSIIAKHIRCNYSSWQDGDMAFMAISKF